MHVRQMKLPRALVVEDDPSWQQILNEILTDSGLEVDVASSLNSAVELVRAEPHRVAILDLSLGGTDHNNQDGLRIAEIIRRSDPPCAILFLTGFATVELAVQVMRDLGALTCLRKEMFRRASFRKAIQLALAQPPVVDTPASGLTTKVSVPAVGKGAQERAAVLVVEDDAGWRSLMYELLDDAGFRVVMSASYVEALGLLKRERCQVAVVDLALANSITVENQDGYRLLGVLQKASVPVIIVSGTIDTARIEQAYSDQLIFACLQKQAFDRKEFLKTVEQARSAAEEDPQLRSLTGREREVLALLARGLTNKEIARDLTITPNTVKRHVKSLFAKLDVNTRSAASAKAIEMGIERS